MPLGSFPVRVLEPPHVLHVPSTAPAAAQPLTIDATANCATGVCTAELQWTDAGGSWKSTAMSATATPLIGRMELVSFTALIPSVDVRAGMQYRIVVDDGHVTTQTPTWSAIIAAS